MKNGDDLLLSIGEFSKICEVSTKTLRYYDEIGSINPDEINYERYFNGYGPDNTHHVASVTKSIISALIGIAADAKYIKNVDQKVLDFFPEYVLSDADMQK